jgi:hypothetical protein
VRLYSGAAQQFIRDTIQNQIADKLVSAFFTYYRFKPSPNEVSAWRVSLRAMSQVVQYAGIVESGVLLEYQLPQSSKRLDCMFTGKDTAAADKAVIVELKQWGECEASDGSREVVTWLGGAKRDVLHPSAQVAQYRDYLADVHTAFYDGKEPVGLKACAYLHNYHFDENDVLYAPKFSSLLSETPTFSGDQVDQLAEFLRKDLTAGDGLSVLKRVEESRYRPAKKLMEHVEAVIKSKPEYILLDEQLVVFDKVLAAAKAGYHDRRKRVLIIQGGPGTGKSVIALNLMAELLGQNYNAQYATGSKAFTETLRRAIGSRGAVQFKYFNSYGAAKSNEIDVLICDEAHRIRTTSGSRFTPRAKRTDVPQIDELIQASKVSVYFVDDDQVVRPNEIGSSGYIRGSAARLNCQTENFELDVQFRCNGSDAFVNWINNTLGIRQTANVLWTGDENFDFRIVPNPEALDRLIRERAGLGHSARLIAGFCWPWSKPNPDGTLKDDVRIGSFLRPWNAKPDAGRLGKNIPPASLWAYERDGINQIGCIYTAQGFEFDYAGVIWGGDLRYDFDNGGWIGDKSSSFDSVVRRSGDKFLSLIKNSYRVLLSRGLKGCYVTFLDKDTERFVRSRTELATFDTQAREAAEPPPEYDGPETTE